MRDFAKAIGCSRQHIYMLESGEKGITLRLLRAYAALMKMDMESVLTGRQKGRAA